jgi:hypothetical protein
MSRIQRFTGFLFGFGFIWTDLQSMELLNKIFDSENNVILFVLIQIFLSSFTEFGGN